MPDVTLTNMDEKSLPSIAFPIAPRIYPIESAANYNDSAAIGASGEDQEFTFSGSPTIALDLVYPRIWLQCGMKPHRTKDEALALIMAQCAFLESCRLPRQLPDGFAGGNTPLLCLSVPNVLAMYVRMRSLSVTPKTDDEAHEITSVAIKVTFKEDPQSRFFSQDIAASFNPFVRV